MSIQGINNSTAAPQLRLTQPTQAAAPVQPVKSVRSAQTDSYQFQSIREAQLPRMPYTQAHKQLEKMRDLIAAKTSVPIYFDEPTAKPSSNNPYSGGYLKFPLNPADRNAAATEAQTTP